MAQVTTQTQLAAAIGASDPDIQIAADFSIDSQQTIGYAATISGVEGGSYTLTKATDYDGTLFQVQGGGSLTLQAITLDGARESHAQAGGSLVEVTNGALTLDTGAVLQNNYARQGGGVAANDSALAPVTVRVQGNAAIRNNRALNNGGGIYVSYQLPDSSLALSGNALVEGNTAGESGGGVYDQTGGTHSTLTITGSARITGNVAPSSGGGVYAVGCDFTLGGQADISYHNGTYEGGGVYWVGRKFLMERDSTIAYNQEANAYGGLYLHPREAFDIGVHGTVLQNNAATAGGMCLDADAAGTIDLSNARFGENEAKTYGGGCVIRSMAPGYPPLTVTIKFVDFFYNQAGYGGGGLYLALSDDSTVRIEVSGFNYNSANQGGGLYLVHNGAGACTLTMEGVDLYGNTGGSEGGAIFLDSGGVTVDLVRMDLLDNRADSGGGLYSAEGTGRITIRGGSEIKENNAASGGGIYHTGDRVLSLEGVTVTENTADTGQGVYNGGPLELGPMAAVPDRLYLPDQDAVPTIVEHLASGSVVQLERSDYVTPTQDGTPIVVARSDLELVGEDAVVFRTPPTGFVGWRFRVSDDRHQVLLTPAEYHLFYENTLGVENPNPIRYTEFTPTITLLPLENTPGNRFLGWYDAAEGGNQVTEIPQGSTGDKTLYARWQVVEYTVTYYGNEGGGTPAENVPPFQRVQGGETATLSDERPTRTGYAFIIWNTDPAGMGTAYFPGETIPNVLSNTNLYAQWEALPPPVHLVTYEPNDASGPPARNMPEPQRFVEGETAYLSTTIPTRTGFYFQGWNTRPDGTGQAYRAGDSVGPLYDDLILYAQWQYVYYTLTYHGNDEGGPPAQNIPIQHDFHFEEVIPIPDTIPTREGYRFTAWNTRPDGGGTTYRPGASFGPTMGDADLYARWEKLPPTLHLLTYEPNDAGGPPAQWVPYPVEVEDGQSIQLSAAIPTRAGSRFLGWNTAPDGAGTAYQPGQTAGPFYAGLTIYAQWRQLWQTLTYHGNDEAGPPAQWVPFPQPVPEGQVIALPGVVPTREGYRFTGWNTQADGGGTPYQPGGSFGPIFSEADLYAQWAALPPGIYTLSYCGNDAGGPPACCFPCPQQVQSGQYAQIPHCAPCRACYCFCGWNTSPDGTGQTVCPGQSVGPVMGDVWLYAQWTHLPPPKSHENMTGH